ncbi:protrudin isoform X8 [Ailuropoda melanoleuca]|uniref:protrudin isoform X8 n=1 Tax=Ailuropoda melanoleuca TaxID=9646 RepID=UPI001494A521|nr:protrudin isoform X8 [Ailuropoda melanoleuca]
MQVTVSGTCSGAWYSVGALMISVPALLGYLQEVCRARLPESELMRRKYHSVRQEDLQKVHLSRPEAVAEVKSFLIQLEAFLSRLCHTCEAAYRVLHWENPAASSQFYGALLGTVCMLYLLPLCWVLALLNSTLFLGNVEFFRVVSEYRACLQRRLNPKQKDSVFESPPLPEAGGKCALPDCTPAPTPTEDLTPGSVEEAEEAEPDEEFKDAIEETHLVVLEDDEGAPCPAEDELVLQDNGFLSKNEVLRSKVSRLTERLRKRYPTNNFAPGRSTVCSELAEEALSDDSCVLLCMQDQDPASLRSPQPLSLSCWLVWMEVSTPGCIPPQGASRDSDF